MSTISNEVGIEYDIYHMLTKIFLLLDDSDRYFFAEHGLTIRQYWALQHLNEEQGCSMIHLSRALLIDKSNITGIVDRLEQLDLVTRTVDLRDRRIMLITLTPQGRDLRETVQAQHHALIQDFMRVLDKNALPNLSEHLQSVIQSIEAHLEHIAT